MSAHRYRLSKDFARDAAGAVLASAKLYFYVTGTTTPLDTFSDAGLSSANTNPVVADSAGFFGDIFLGNGGPYKAVLKTSADVTIFTEDPVYRAKVRHYLAALPSVNWPGMEVVLTTDNHLHERNAADDGWNDRGDADTAINAASVSETLTGTSVAKVVTPDGLAALWQRGANITPSGGTATLPSGGGGVFNIAAGNFAAISSAQGGRRVTFVFAGASTITHDATALILLSGATETTYAGMVKEFVNEAAADASGGNWREVSRGAIATQAQMETGTAIEASVAVGRQHFHPAHPKFFAYVTVSAGTPTLARSHNVTSITDTGTGQLTVTIATDFSGTDWAPFVSHQRHATAASNSISMVQNAGQAAGTILALCEDETANPAPIDPAAWSIFGLGDLA